jgi:hypothetical protein
VYPTGVGIDRPLASAAVEAALHDRYGEDLLPLPVSPLRHPNGFLKIPVAHVARDGRRLFLHVWPEETRDAHRHDHRWHLASLVIAGCVVNETFDVAPAPEEPGGRERLWRIAHYVPEAHHFRLVPTPGPRVVIRNTVTTAVGASSSYQLPAEAFHRAGTEAGTMTLVARSTPLSPHSRVLIDSAPDGSPVPWRPVSERERRSRLREAMERLR